MCENEQNIRQSHKHHEGHGKLESEISSRGINPSRGENLKMHLPKRFILTNSMC